MCEKKRARRSRSDLVVGAVAVMMAWEASLPRLTLLRSGRGEREPALNAPNT